MKRRCFIIKQITKNQFKLLLDEGVIYNTRDGIVDIYGNPTGYYTTRHHIYIEDRLADEAIRLSAPENKE